VVHCHSPCHNATGTQHCVSVSIQCRTTQLLTLSFQVWYISDHVSDSLTHNVTVKCVLLTRWNLQCSVQLLLITEKINTLLTIHVHTTGPSRLEVHGDNALADYRPADSAPNNRPITDCLFQDGSLFNKSHIVTIVKSQWYDRRLVTLLP